MGSVYVDNADDVASQAIILVNEMSTFTTGHRYTLNVKLQNHVIVKIKSQPEAQNFVH